MAAPTYATDLAVLDDFESGDNTLEPSSVWTAGRGNTTDTDFPIQSATHASLVMNTTGKAGLLTDVSPITWVSGDYLFGWDIWLAPGAIAVQASGGLVMLAGSGAGDYKVFYVGGKDFGSYPYGGWQNFAVDPELTADETVGTPDGDYDFVGVGANVLSAVAKGSPLGMDVFRYGRGEFRVAAGDGTTPATFAGMAAVNDADTARWGLFQAVEGAYKAKGLMIWGYAAAVEFTDANADITVENTEYVASDFNGLEIRNVGSVIDVSNVKVTALGTVAPWYLEMVDNADVTLTAWTFVDIGTTTLLSNGSLLGCTWRGAAPIDAGGADLTGSSIEGYEGTAGTAALLWDVATNPIGLLDGMTFKKGVAATHAIELGPNCPASINLNDWIVTGYNAVNGNNDCVVYNNSGKAITINVSGNTGVISYRNGTSATTVVQNTVTTTIKNVPTGAEWRLYEADPTQGIIGSTELDGAESHTGGDITYADNYSADTNAALQVLASGYIEFLRYFVLGAAPQTITVILEPETNT